MKVSKDRIREARGKMTIDELALSIGGILKKVVQRQVVENWETGANAPSSEYLRALSLATGKKMEWFFENGKAA